MSKIILEFGNLKDILRARRGCQLALFAQRTELQMHLEDLRTEYDPEIRGYVVPGCKQGACRDIRARIGEIEDAIREVSFSIAGLEKEKVFVEHKGFC